MLVECCEKERERITETDVNKVTFFKRRFAANEMS